MSEMRFDRSMSDAEGLMWRLEKDPHLSSTFANVTILDRPPDFALLRRRMERAVLRIPEMEDLLAPIAAVVPLQLLAYHVARMRGHDIDQPRNLAKSVTVE